MTNPEGCFTNYLTPQNLTNVQAFLGFTGYYCYFIQDHSQIVWPLLSLMKKMEAWHWDQAQEDVFHALKIKICMALVICQPDFTQKFYLQTDASTYGIGTILLQEGDPNSLTPMLARQQKLMLHLVTYYSATFTPTEWNYDTYERELLAMMKALSHWRQYLGWTREPFTIMTNHANL
jgi:hypothetical protein